MMHKMLIEKSFDAFWIGCQANNIMSVLTASEPSYLMAGAQNDFAYEITGRSGWFKSPTVLYGEELEHALYKVRRMPYVFETDDPVAELLRRIRENRIISVEIDLFFWNPDSLDYHRNHVNHMSMCVGADEERQVFYFDDAVVGQGLLTKPFSGIQEALVRKDGELNAVELCVPEHPAPYIYDIARIRRQAEKLVHNLELLRYQSYFSTFEQPQDLNIIVNNVIKVYNRELANQVLVRQLYLDGHLAEPVFQTLMQKAKELAKQWNLIKNKLMKMMLAGRKHDFTKLNQRADQAFAAEQEFWSLLAGRQTPQTVSAAEPDSITPLHPAGALLFAASDEIQTLRSGIRLEQTELILDPESEYYSYIRLYFGNVAGSLHADSDRLPFHITSVSEGFTAPDYVKAVQYEGSSVLLKTECPFADIAGLWHFTLKTDETVTVTDDSGQKCPLLRAPCLGIAVRETPFINVLECSPPQRCDVTAEAPYPAKDVPFAGVSFANYECDLSVLCKESPPEQEAVYCRIRLDSQTAAPVRLWFGHQGAAKLWINGREAGYAGAKPSPPHQALCCAEFSLRDGENEVMLLCSTNQAKARGILLKLAWTAADSIRIRDDLYTEPFPEFMSHCG